MICIPIKQKNLQLTTLALKEAQKAGDLTEIWFDELGKNLNEQSLTEIMSLKKKPIIYKSLGKLENIELVLNHQLEFIDLDISTNNKIIKRVKELSPNTKIILSFHDFEKTPTSKQLHSLALKMLQKKADILKFATMARDFSDSLRVLSFLAEISSKHDTIALAMGSKGKITRSSGHLFGNYLMYAPLSVKNKTAPGQISAKELKQIRLCLSK